MGVYNLLQKIKGEIVKRANKGEDVDILNNNLDAMKARRASIEQAYMIKEEIRKEKEKIETMKPSIMTKLKIGIEKGVKKIEEAKKQQVKNQDDYKNPFYTK